MSTFHDEAAAAHGSGNPSWRVTYYENFSGIERSFEVGATSYQQAINKGTDRLNLDLSKPAGYYYFKSCTRLPAKIH